MILRLLLFLALGYGVYRVVRWLRAAPPEQARKRYLQAGLLALAAVVLALAITGRIHWLGAVVAAMLPLLQRASGLLPLIWPWLRRRLQGDSAAHDSNAGNAAPPSAATLDRAEALAILGLHEGASEDEVVQAHRRLMQKLHPDRGGSDYLAARINAAKEKLLEDRVA